VKAGGFVFVSGCVGVHPDTKALVPGGLGPQARQVLENMKNILEASGASLSKVVKCTVLLADMSYFAELNGIYGEYFSSDPPARATFAVAGLPLGALVEIDCVAIVGE
jgi:2-iminobutanoate/2-iminopropanoate deaminase